MHPFGRPSCLLFLAGSMCLGWADGRIVVTHDEWTLSPTGFSSPNTPGRFVRNVAAWFNGGAPGTFLARSSNFGLTNVAIANALALDGHTYTINTSTPMTLSYLQQFDGVFVGGATFTTAVLTQYVQGGGNVYICGGAGGGIEFNAFNAFLNAFGLSFASGYNGLSGNRAISNAHPIFAQVTSLYENSGSTIIDTQPANPANQILISQGSSGLYAVYDPVTGATISGTVELQDFEGNVGAQSVTMELYNGGTLLETHQVPLSADGTYSFSVTNTGTFDIYCKGSHWLRQVESGVIVSGAANNVDFSLINGDVDGDNEVTLVDFGATSAAFGSVAGDANWNPMADLDGDEEVSLIDVAIVSSNFGLAGD